MVYFSLDKPGSVLTSNVGTILPFTGNCINCLASHYLSTGKMPCYDGKHTECIAFIKMECGSHTQEEKNSVNCKQI
jgi:hypothetical protein